MFTGTSAVCQLGKFELCLQEWSPKTLTPHVEQEESAGYNYNSFLKPELLRR